MTQEAREPPAMRGLSRAMEILLMFGQEPEFGIRDLARRLDLDPAVVHRTVTTLTSYGFIERARGSSRYILGPAVRELAVASQRNQSFSEIALHYMARLRDETGETVALHSLRDGLRHCTFILESPHHLRIVLPAGESALVTAGATDLVFRSFAGPDDLRRIDERVAQADPSEAPDPTMVDQGALDEIRLRGWVASFGIRIAGACAVAAPVVLEGAVLALTVFGPRDRMVQTGVDAIAPHLLAASKELVSALAATPGERP